MLSRKIALLLLMFMTLSFANAQRNELGLRVGQTNLVGDIGRTNYLFQQPFYSHLGQFGLPVYVGLIYRMNFNPYQSLRLDLGYGNVQFNDAVAKENYRVVRNLNGRNSGADFNLLFEYYFYPANNKHKAMLSPYIFGGIGGLFYDIQRVSIDNDFKRDASGNILPPNSQGIYSFTSIPVQESAGKAFSMGVPFGIGLKYKFNYNWAISGELMFKPTFSDGIDYSVINDKYVKMIFNKELLDPATNKSILQGEPYITIAKDRLDNFVKNNGVGNLNSKDWINSFNVMITYSFGRPPCYCD